MIRTLVLAAAVSVSLPVSASASGLDGFSGFFVFGDSTTDPGNAFAAVPGAASLIPDGFYENGQLTDGDTWAVQLGADFASGRNFAWGGAKAQLDGAFDVGFPGGSVNFDPLDLPEQVDTFLDAVSAGDLSIGTNALGALWIAGNDVRGAIPALIGGADITDAFNPILNSIGTEVGRLLDAGLSEVVVFGLPDLGLLPQISVLGPAAQGLARTVSIAWNSALQARLNGTPTVSYFDVFGLFEGIVDDPAAAGFTNVTDPCIDEDTFTVVANCATSIFYDSIHPTEAAHAIIAENFVQQVGDSHPPAIPLPAGGLLLVGGLGALMALRRARKAAA